MYRNYLCLLGIALIWGSQFLFQQAAVADIPPVWVGAGRSMIGFITLIIVCRLLNLRGNGGQWKTYHLVGFLEATIPFVLVAWGQQYLKTSVTAVLMGTIPFFTIMLAPLVIKGTRITLSGISSVLLGFAGLLLLFYPELSSNSASLNLIAVSAVIAASACFAIGLLLLKGVSNENPLIVARNVIGCATVQIMFFALVVSPVTDLSPTTKSLQAVAYLGVFCAGLVYYLYMMLIQSAGPVFASFNNYLTPMIGVLLGATVNGEDITAYTWVALAIILLAVGFNQYFSSKSAKQNIDRDDEGMPSLSA